MGKLFGMLQSAAPPTPEAPEIKVTGGQLPSNPAELMNPDAAIRPEVEAIKQRLLTEQQLQDRKGVQNLPEHKGLFGMKGSLRDILGTLGDALMASQGLSPTYAPQRRREKTSDAMAEMVNSPIKAVQALLGTGEYEKAYEIYKDFQVQGNRDEQLRLAKQQADAVTALNQARLITEQDKGRELFGATAGSVDSAEAWKRVRPALAAIAERRGIDISDMPEEYDPVWLKTIQAQGMTPYQQVQAKQSSERSAETARHYRATEENTRRGQGIASADRRRGQDLDSADRRNKTPVMEAVRRKIAAGQKLTPGEQKIYNDSLPKGNRFGGTAATAPKTGTGVTYKIVK